ncbi:Glycosyl hydrolases family 43 [Flaviramulus basaltis]|uniref:Glycosyl hydrolases family 43 n=1 Tax=Flaviramulus basaltis TaxID=369401 RepID=A0A1K2IQS7_9FLAO|nr:family 43 glycosylhydrolase [Flaviramulus basaltis]SFZ94067.1 Glycosyl hydrolases family 43 [Flaviramulus basaltis]
MKSQLIKSCLFFVIIIACFSSCKLNKSKILNNKEYESYLFTYFIGNSPGEEAIRYALSKDGYNYFALNNNKPIVDSKDISNSGGVRDPHILRSEDGEMFYMVVTDLYVPEQGWNNYAMVLMKSTDLINWTASKINIPEMYPEAFGNIDRVWAPQTIYDKESKRYMVYWSMHTENNPDIIYYAFANEDFTSFETTPKQLYFSPTNSACIDGDIIYQNGQYHLFFKNEDNSQKGIMQAVSNNLTEGYIELKGNADQTTEAVEGSSVFKLINSETYILMYDMYMKGAYQFAESTDLKQFKVVDNAISMDFHPRHGTVIPITKEEEQALLDKWGGINENYFSLPTKKVAALPNDKNPVLDGFYADPEIIYSQKDKKYYLYPTSDGFTNWSGTYFKAFSSTDLVSWKDEGVILDLKKDVSWADKNAWAPTMIEKKIGDTYKYFYYFTAAQKIGVAVSNSPTGPFVDSGKPLISSPPKEFTGGGQEIDPDIFADPISGKNYLYWGNGYLACVELNDDMISIKENTIKLMTPDATFREGAEVFFRNGIYYFLWSEDDTRSPDYRVRYAMSNSPIGELIIPENNLILAKNTENEIYGTGHNSVIQTPNTNEWHIVYHRFNRPKGITMGNAAGYNREVCIDVLEFNEDGSIKPIVPII